MCVLALGQGSFPGFQSSRRCTGLLGKDHQRNLELQEPILRTEPQKGGQDCPWPPGRVSPRGRRRLVTGLQWREALSCCCSDQGLTTRATRRGEHFFFLKYNIHFTFFQRIFLQFSRTFHGAWWGSWSSTHRSKSGWGLGPSRLHKRLLTALL